MVAILSHVSSVGKDIVELARQPPNTTIKERDDETQTMFKYILSASSALLESRTLQATLYKPQERAQTKGR